jgi:thymidylate synthase
MMMEGKVLFLEAKNLGEAWTLTMWHTLHDGRPYYITSGSRANQHRMVMDCCFLHVSYPETRPLWVPAKEGQVPVCDEQMAQTYFEKYVYCFDPPEPNEHYRYNEYLSPQAEAIIKLYKEQGYGTAHCTMRVGNPHAVSDYFQAYQDETSRPTTPCLVSIDTRIIAINGIPKLVFYIMYRSWDLFGGFPTNNAGFQMLKEYMAAAIGVECGATYMMCKDLHLYEEDIPAAAGYTGQDTASLLQGLAWHRKLLNEKHTS